ncbi:MAG: AAA family ATPase [Elusimicrobia bacterium]|nr:AAA family ATPase [Elusimicrobiota bacterium]
MIEELRIKNFAVIEDLTLRLSSGFNVVTGETGAGKSVLVQALSFLGGEPVVSSDYLRSGAEKMEVSIFCRLDSKRNPNMTLELENLGIEWQEGISARRFYEPSTNRTRAFINDTPVTLATLKKLWDSLAERHGQDQSLELERSDFARKYLDHWGGLDQELARYRALYAEFQQAKQDLERHRQFVAQNSERLDILRHNRDELEEIFRDPEKLRELDGDLSLWMGRDRLMQGLCEVDTLLGEGQVSAGLLVSRAKALALKLVQQSDNHSDFRDMAQNLERCSDALDEVARQAAALKSSLDYEPARLEELLALKAKRDRLMAKYHLADIEGLRRLQERTAVDLETLEASGERDGALAAALEKKREALAAQGGRLSIKRQRLARELGPLATQRLRPLGFAKVVLECDVIKRDEPDSSGLDRVVFWFSPNPGEGKRELGQIASGGERSRIALILKNLILERPPSITHAPEDRPDLLVLDEIEQGLSAEVTALAAAQLSKLSVEYQVLAITHSAVLACSADSHFVLEKRFDQGRTMTEARALVNAKDREREVLRLLGAVSPKDKKMLSDYVEKLLQKKRTQSLC